MESKSQVGKELKLTNYNKVSTVGDIPQSPLIFNGYKKPNGSGEEEQFITLAISEKSKEAVGANNANVSPKKQKGWRKYLGILLTIAAATQFSLSALIIKVLNYHPFNLGVWRFFVMMLIPIPFLWHALFWKKQNVFKVFWPVNRTLIYLGVS